MDVEPHLRPVIWVLKGLRHGDNAQAMALALRLGARVETKPLTFNALHVLPHWATGAGVHHLTADAKSLLRPPWPDLVVATGRRTAAVACWIKQQSGGRSKLVQLGRPRMALHLFDLVITSPQYGLPAAANVVCLPLPFAIPKKVASEELEHFKALWAGLPRPWVLGVIGGGKFPMRLNGADLAHFGHKLSAKAAELGGSVVLLDSPRSPAGALQTVQNALSVPQWTAGRGHSPNPYQAALQLCDHLAVTSDSVSMMSEMVMSQKPVWVYRLHRSALAPRWSAEQGVLATLAKAGVLQPPRNVEHVLRNLTHNGLIADLNATAPQPAVFSAAQHEAVVERVRQLLPVLRSP